MADKVPDKVIKLEDILKDKSNNPNPEDSKQKTLKIKKEKKVLPKGVRKSGRFWKHERTKSSNIIKTRGIKQANKFKKLKRLKEEVNRMRMLSKNIVDARNEQIEAKKERRRQNLRRAEENKLKSEIVQEIRNPAKIKRMRRKLLRTIEKRDTLKMK